MPCPPCCPRATSSSTAATPTTRTTSAAARPSPRKGLRYLDVGTSGGVWGLQRGYCMMIGGDAGAVKHLDPIFAALAPGIGTIERTPGREGRDARAEQGYIHAGPVGAGHFVKMIHNGIEYGMMQAMAEGFDILRNKAATALPADERYDLNMGDIAEVWRRGSVVTSWLLDLTADALAKDEKLDDFSGEVEDSGEGRWTIEAAIEEAVPADVLAASLFTRFRSRQQHTFAEKVLSAMRFGFGGHVEPNKQMTIVVVMGVSGSGKTTIAAGLARAGRLDPAGGRLVPPASQHRQDEGRHAADRRGPLALAARHRRAGGRTAGRRPVGGGGVFGVETGRIATS